MVLTLSRLSASAVTQEELGGVPTKARKLKAMDANIKWAEWSSDEVLLSSAALPTDQAH